MVTGANFAFQASSMFNDKGEVRGPAAAEAIGWTGVTN
jgi:hypothetical protein